MYDRSISAIGLMERNVSVSDMIAFPSTMTAFHALSNEPYSCMTPFGSGIAEECKITTIEIQLPREPGFDTYSLKQESQSEIKSVEQGKK